ncbi:hypothetical protein ACH5RR_008221 [Cinchona calisaya]|uniref:Leucine-rich repeat-containing N-terminal plant-type domain-containing protein n=1 Tax=Cinchona calisaya TaxID=153742 RepID=A0ABD3AAZ6_9GENT
MHFHNIVVGWAMIIISILIHDDDATSHLSLGCILEEKSALLEFKASLKVPQEHAQFLLPSWIAAEGHDPKMTDCCKWERVKCSNTTGRIVELQLHDLTHDIFQKTGELDLQHWSLNFSIFLQFKELRALDLGGNVFEIGCGQSASFTNLQALYLDYIFFNSSSSIISCIGAMSSLKNLSLAGNDLEDLSVLQEFNHLKQLEFLDLSSNPFYNSFKGCGQSASFKNLKTLYLEDHNFLNSSIIPCIGAMPSLKRLSLARNDLVDLSMLEEWKLEKLEVLNLGENTRLDNLSSLEALTSLKALSLRNSRVDNFSILQGLCKLKNLVHLDLSENGFNGHVPLCFSNLTSLRVFDISYNNFSGNIPPLIHLIHLEYVSLSGNYFDGYFPLNSLANHSKLQVFKLEPKSHDLHVDDENFVLPPSFQLKVLHLARCNLNEKFRRIPSFLLYQNELRNIDISHNELFGEFPNWLLENNTRLERVNLNNNSFTGPFILSDGPPKHLVGLDISNNECNGLLPQNIGLAFPKLEILNLSGNFFEGHIPQSLGNLTLIVSMDLSDNAFSGEVPHQIITGRAHFEYLKLSRNSLEGHFPWNLVNLTRLKTLHLDNNYFVGAIPNDLSYSFDFESLDISNNKFEGKIPGMIGNFLILTELDMSNNLLEGTIPNELCKLEGLNLLDLSQNQLSGSIPLCSNLLSLRFINLQKNQITGTIPKTLFMSLDLLALDLSHNHLSGGIPCVIGQLTRLRVLLLGENNFQGQIPICMCLLKKLTFLDISKNNFSGRIPKCFNNISFGRGNFDEAEELYNEDNISGGTYTTSTEYVYNNSYIDVLSESYFESSSYLQENVEFTAKSRVEIYVGKILNFMSGLDLSCNQLGGKIPPEFGDMSDLHALNLSHNYLNGSIPASLSMLKQIESLDLSVNSLSGEIPSELTKLNSLAVFNVSYNNLSGGVPDKGQFASMDDSNFKGNPGLCGPLLKRSCNHTSSEPGNVDDHGEEVDNGLDMVALIWSFFASYMDNYLAGNLMLVCNVSLTDLLDLSGHTLDLIRNAPPMKNLLQEQSHAVAE